MIKNKNNLIVIGRSGTGKTLCGLSRIIAAETLINKRMEEYNKLIDVISGEEEKRCNYHCVFITASSILAKEVCRKYIETMDMLEGGNINKKTAISKSQKKVDEIPDRMDKLEDKHFPLFVTARQLLILVDTTLKEPFFKKSHSKALQSLERIGRWGLGVGVGANEGTGCKLEITEEDIEGITCELEKDIKGTSDNSDKEEIKDEVKGIEVQYEQFRVLFWNKFYKRKKLMPNISCSAVWKEIYTYIKGSIKSHENAKHYLSLQEYKELFKPGSILTPKEEEEIYEIFLSYQRWMQDNENYDLLDILNHVLANIKWGYRGVPFHEMICDEVQDLPPAYFLFLGLITEQKLFFAGDTAQSIVEGVGFRFQDLKHIFFNFPIPVKMPLQKELSINFRSHMKILDLATSVIRLLELLFPESIDKLKKEQSKQDGMKPMVLNNEDELAKSFLQTTGQDSESHVQFGFDQAVIVRSKEVEDELPSFLRSYLVFTLQECKGLEFSEVILFNFFENSSVDESHWRLLDHISVDDVNVPFDLYKVPEKDIDPKESQKQKARRLADEEARLSLLIDKLEVKDKTLLSKNRHGKGITVKHVGLKEKIFNINTEYRALSVELKQLYTAITRAKEKLYIYDKSERSHKRHILNYWKKLDFIAEYKEEIKLFKNQYVLLF